MIVTIVDVQVKPECIDDFIKATTLNHERSIEEPGNLRFDVLRTKADPARFFLYEAYESDEAAAAHKKTQHYAAWRETVEPMMARPRIGTPCDVINPRELAKW